MSSGTTLNALTFTLYGSQKEKREKGPEKVFEEIVTENFTKLEKEMAALSSILAWRIPWTEGPGRL